MKEVMELLSEIAKGAFSQGHGKLGKAILKVIIMLKNLPK